MTEAALPMARANRHGETGVSKEKRDVRRMTFMKTVAESRPAQPLFQPFRSPAPAFNGAQLPNGKPTKNQCAIIDAGFE
jgi:hypothetical protein